MNSPLPLPVAGQLHLWHGATNDFDGCLQQLERLLSNEELQRARRFRRDADSRSFVASRGLLRILTGRYLGLSPDQVRFGYAAQGKPCVTPTQNRVGLEFNLSHAADVMLFAFSAGSAVGVDVEHVKRKLDIDSVGRRVLHANEWSSLRDAGPEQRRDLFFRYWVAKEAILKGIGAGIGAGMQLIEVHFETTDSTVALIDHGGLTGREHWTLRLLDIMPDYAGAAAVAGSDPTIVRLALSTLLPL